MSRGDKEFSPKKGYSAAEGRLGRRQSRIDTGQTQATLGEKLGTIHSAGGLGERQGGSRRGRRFRPANVRREPAVLTRLTEPR